MEIDGLPLWLWKLNADIATVAESQTRFFRAHEWADKICKLS